MKTHCITLKQSEVGAKTIRFDVLERNEKWRWLPGFQHRKLLFMIYSYSAPVAISEIW